MRDVRRNVLPKFTELNMEPFEGYQRDGREFLALQPRDRVAMLRVNTTEFFREEFT